MSFQSTFYRSLIYFHAFIAIAEFVLTFTLIITVLHNPELFFKITGPDDEDWELIAEGYRIAIWILFLIGTIRTVIMLAFVFLIIFSISTCLCLSCLLCCREQTASFFTAKSTHRCLSFNCNCPCYRARPTLRFQLKFAYSVIMLCVRVATIVICLTIRHHVTAKSLAIIIGMSFFFLILACLLDYYHYRVWWHYKPQFTDIGFFFEMPTTPLSRKHKRYIPYHLLGDHRTESFGDKTCSAGADCKNRQLEHIFIFHFRGYNPQRRYFDIIRADNPKNLYIGFHQTDPASAVLIAHSDFRISTGPRSTMLGHGIYFARSREGTENKANRRGAFICAEINMGRVLRIRSRERFVYSGKKTWWRKHDTAYYCHPDPKFDEFCVKSPDQILRWIIVIEKRFDRKVENYGLDTEFDDTKCGCF
ncbi:unnamed protein product [Adineta ricciae]|uniref:PARP catalytic domain-containing protein n=1 Tax=Adineta ricciae TaxID=249248 RepID=A0A815ZKF9_ADIRI|nr:unnamed protein product [Adineta ricciae]CAF1585857.1 unnamed protein product [Adineta ricciae]